jgi:hypothetical protein
LVNILVLRLCNYDKSPDHVESAGKFTLISRRARRSQDRIRKKRKETDSFLRLNTV